MKYFLEKSLYLFLAVLLSLSGFVSNVSAEESAKSLYLKAEANTLAEIWDRIEAYSGDSIELQDRLLQEAYESESTINVSFDVRGKMVEPYQLQLMIAKNFLSDLTFKISSKVDPDTNKLAGNVNLYLDETNIGNIELYQDEENMALKIPVLYPDYFIAGNEDLSAFLNTESGIEPMSDEITGTEDNSVKTYNSTVPAFPNIVEYNQTTWSYAQLKEIGLDYLNLMKEQLREDQFKLDRNANFNGNKYDKVSIHISEKEAKQMFKVLLEKLKDDERIWNVLYKQMELQGVAVEQEQAMIENGLMEAIVQVENLNIPEGIMIEAYIKDNIVVHETIQIAFADETGEKIYLDLTSNYEKEDNSQYALTSSIEIHDGQDNGRVSLLYKEKGLPEGDDMRVNHLYQMIVDGESDEDSFNAGLNVSTLYSDEWSKSTFELNLAEIPQEAGKLPEIKGYINKKLMKSSQNQYHQTTEFGIDVYMADSEEIDFDGTLEYSLDETIHFTDELQFPDIQDGENAVNPLTASPEKLEEIGLEIQKNAMKYFETFMYLYGEKYFFLY